MHEEIGNQQQQGKDAHCDDRQTEHVRVMLHCLLVVILDHVQNRCDLPGAHTSVEAVVTIPCETDITIRAIQIAIGIQQLSQREQRGLVHHSVAHITQGRLRQPVAHLVFSLTTHPTVIAGDGILTAVRTDTAHPLVADLTGVCQLLTGHQLLDPIHQIVWVVMVDHGEERVAIGTLPLEILFFHRGDDAVVAQLAIDMHLRLIVVTQSDAVELLLVDVFQEGECLIVIAHGGALESLQHLTVPCLCHLSLALCTLLGLVEVIEG